MKTVGIVVWGLRGGGTERVAAILSTKWSQLGFRIVFLTSRTVEQDEFPHVSDFREQFDLARANEQKIYSVTQKYAIDFMVFHGGWNTKNFDFVVKAVKKNGIPVIVVVHHSFSGWTFNFANIGDFDKDTIRDDIDALVCVNPVQAVWWHMRGFRTVYIQNPVSIEKFDDTPYKFSEDLFWVGRPRDAAKRVTTAIEIYCEVRKIIRTSRLIIVGEIDAKEQLRITKNISKNVCSGIIWAGYSANFQKQFGRHGIHILTSLYESTTPQVLYEMATCGVPTVMFDLPVCYDATSDHGVTQVKTNDEFVETIVEILKFPELAYRLSERTFQWGNKLKCDDGVSAWKRLFDAISSADDIFFLEMGKHYLTGKYYELALREVNRTERLLIKKHVGSFGTYNRRENKFKCLFIKIVKIVRLLSVQDKLSR